MMRKKRNWLIEKRTYNTANINMAKARVYKDGVFIEFRLSARELFFLVLANFLIYPVFSEA